MTAKKATAAKKAGKTAKAAPRSAKAAGRLIVVKSIDGLPPGGAEPVVLNAADGTITIRTVDVLSPGGKAAAAGAGRKAAAAGRAGKKAGEKVVIAETFGAAAKPVKSGKRPKVPKIDRIVIGDRAAAVKANIGATRPLREFLAETGWRR